MLGFIRRWFYRWDLRVRHQPDGVVIVDFETMENIPTDARERESLVKQMFDFARSSQIEGIIATPSGKQLRIHREAS